MAPFAKNGETAPSTKMDPETPARRPGACRAPAPCKRRRFGVLNFRSRTCVSPGPEMDIFGPSKKERTWRERRKRGCGARAKCLICLCFACLCESSPTPPYRVSQKASFFLVQKDLFERSKSDCDSSHGPLRGRRAARRLVYAYTLVHLAKSE